MIRRLGNLDRELGAALAGTLLLLAGAAILIGIITAESLFPRPYNTADNAISDLGSTFEPSGEMRQPSAAIFNTLMIATGLMIAVAGRALRPLFAGRTLPILVGLLGVFIFLVGVFPGTVESGEPSSGGVHPLVAFLTFATGGIAAIFAGRVTRPPFRYVSILLGGVGLLSLVLSGWLGGTGLGEGGIERWVAYPIILWLVAFGAYVLGAATTAKAPTQ